MKLRRKRMMEKIRFEFRMELRRRKNKKRRRCRRVFCKTLRASTKIRRKTIPENRSHMKEKSISDFKTRRVHRMNQ
jgi:hypothetical protein